MTLKRGKILIADDNEDILFTLKMLLRPIAESISITTDPRELLPILSRTHYDVILLDMNFRNDAVSGREGFHWLEEILKTGFGSSGNLHHGLCRYRKGCTGHQARRYRLHRQALAKR